MNTLCYPLLAIWLIVDILYVLSMNIFTHFCHLSSSNLLLQTKEKNFICLYFGEDYFIILVSLP